MRGAQWGLSSKLSRCGTSVTPVSEKELVFTRELTIPVTPVSEKELVEQAYMVHYLYKSEPIVLHSGQGAFVLQ